MATIEFHEGDPLRQSNIRRVAARAIALNEELGDPTRVSPPRLRLTGRGAR
jgi:hypothetical protein